MFLNSINKLVFVIDRLHPVQDMNRILKYYLNELHISKE
jgi:hypothetical protein